jgi:hypothetical protein
MSSLRCGKCASPRRRIWSDFLRAVSITGADFLHTEVRCRQRLTFWGANLILVGGPRAARDDFAPRADTFAHAGQLCVMEGSDGDALATPGGGRWELRRQCAATVRFGKFQTKSPQRISPRGLCYFCDDGVMPVICPTCQTVSERSTNFGKFDETVSTN